MMPLNIIILAAGKGTRMHSNIPKVLHKIGGKAILGHVIECAKALKPQKIIVVYGFGGETVRDSFANENITWAVMYILERLRIHIGYLINKQQNVYHQLVGMVNCIRSMLLIKS